MFSIFKALIQQYLLIPQYNVIILGLQNTGKTRFFNLIKNYDNLAEKLAILSKNYNPTVGLNSIYTLILIQNYKATKFKTNDIRICFWDLGGKRTIRKLWQNYYSQSHGIIFFIDDKNQDKLYQSYQILKQTIRHNQMVKIPLILLIKNKQTQQILKNWIQKQPQLINRQIVIKQFQFEQIGVLGNAEYSINRQKLSLVQLLKWMYFKISQLDKQVQKY